VKTDSLKIIILGPIYPYRGGIASDNEILAGELIKLGHDVEVFTFSLQYPKFFFPGKTQFVEHQKAPDIPISRKINSINPFNWLKVGLELRRKNADLIISRFWLPLIGPSIASVALLGKQGRKRLHIGIIDNIIPHEKRPGDRPFAKYYLWTLHGGIVMSKIVEKDVRTLSKRSLPLSLFSLPIYSQYGDKIKRDSALEQLKLDLQKKYILFFGFIRKYKGLDLLLESMLEDRLLGEPDIHLIIAGEFYDDEERYLNLINDERIKSRVHLFSDYIPEEDVRVFFSAADLVVQPYRTATQSGITQIAYHFGIPMIVSNVGGLPDIVHDGDEGFVVDPEPGAISKAIIRFFKETDKEQMKKQVLESAKNFSGAAYASNLIKLYHKLRSNV
jgi:glycosyltransferase involved in cell wall biosynthesis